jgi:8-oxo-dGTP diphosphatase
MGVGDGNGWVLCHCGHRHWGVFGAAGLLLARRSVGRGGVEVLLQLRAAWTHQGGTWGLPGGATDSHEDPRTGALREALEETGVAPDAIEVLGLVTSADHGDWAYRVVLARPSAPVDPRPTNDESDALRWVPVAEVAGLLLHPGLALSWQRLRAELDAVLPA